ncbi:hypothetical protein GQ55_5G464900 [Panicum hallii var. hallii]|uniref:Uncharacterized protein n=1 Tax=Panicum hallii var. hallii TaxID=1504633 RepID=A0A2T7DQP0_9POAL|nr:hypothetical protein GQ55_5G464900 [Panicum hallii var. hallii]
MEEAPELISPRISFSHDLANFAAPPRRSDDASLLVSSSRLPEPEFDFANANAAADDVAPADRLFAGGKLLPMPPLPPAPRPSPCKLKQEPGGGGIRVKAQACPQKRPGSWASPFSRSSSVNSATTVAGTTGAPRSAGRFGCPPFPLMRSRSASAAVARDGGLGPAAVPDAATGHPPRYYKKFGGTVAPASNGGGGGSSRAYYYGGNRKGSSHGVRVSPVLNVPFIGTSVANVLSYLLCDCSTKTKKSREF